MNLFFKVRIIKLTESTVHFNVTSNKFNLFLSSFTKNQALENYFELLHTDYLEKYNAIKSKFEEKFIYFFN